MATWDAFRALAARLGLGRDKVEAVERSGEPGVIEHPLDQRVQIHVRPDPNWSERMTEAWNGSLKKSRRASAGAIPILDGRLVVGDANSINTASGPEEAVVADVVPGIYEVTVTIAHLGARRSGDYEEHVSHAWALLRDNPGVAVIEPLLANDGAEQWLEMATSIFTGTAVVERLAAAHPEVGVWQIVNLPPSSIPITGGSQEKWKRITTSDGSGALVTTQSGYGRNSYPLFRMADPQGRTVGILIDYFVDNRPYGK